MTQTDITKILEAIERLGPGDTPPPWFDRWQREVYQPGQVGMLSSRASAMGAVADRHADEVTADAQRWRDNEVAHKDILGRLDPILARLDLLNGFKNKVMGICAIVVFSAPLVVSVWLLATR